MKKSQTSVISTVLITGIVITVVTLTYIWGKPLLQKNMDNAKINSIINMLKQIDRAIQDVADTTSPNQLKIELSADESLSVNPDGELIFKTITSVPLVTTYDWGPINHVELPYTDEQYTISFSNTNSSVAQSCDGVTDGIYVTTQTLTHNDGTSQTYNITLYNTTATSGYDYLCITGNYDSFTCADNCGYENDTITKLSTGFLVYWINASGDIASIKGRRIEKVGELGTEDPAGVIIAKSSAARDHYMVTFKLIYRPLQDPATGNLHEIKLNCERDCYVGEGQHTVYITTTEQPTGSFSTNEYYINIRIV